MHKFIAVLKTFLFFWILSFVAFILVLLAFDIFTGFDSLGHEILRSIIWSFVIVAVILPISLICDARKLYRKLLKELGEEITANGYSERVMDLADQGLKACDDPKKYASPICSFSSYGAEAAIFNEDYQQAKERAYVLMKNSVYISNNMVSAHLALAKIANRQGDTELKEEMLAEVRNIIDKTNRPLARQAYELCLNEM
ncbi:MAG: hypothetical protein K6E27_04870 [Eubacterium sp.]|nr:hypothetical protein [Eubacterium sp.]